MNILKTNLHIDIYEQKIYQLNNNTIIMCQCFAMQY